MKRNEILGEISDKALQRYSQAAHTDIQGAKFGRGKGTPEGEKTIAKREKGMAAAGKRLKARDDEKRANYKRPEPAKTSSGPQDWYGQNRYMGDSVEQGGSSVKSLQAKAREISDKIDAIVSNGGRVGLDDPLSRQLKAIRNKIKQAKQGVAENYPKHQDLSGISTDKLKAYLAKQGQQQSPGEGNQVKRVRAELQRRSQGVAEGLDEGRSDYVGDAIEGLRMAKPGLEKEDFLDELYSYIDAEMGMEAAEAAFADKDSYDDWYESYADAVDENANMLKVAKDDDQQTILQNPSTGVQTQIDKKNPNAPTLTKDETTGKLKLAAPANNAGSATPKPDLTGKDVEVATESADLAAVLRIAGLR